MSEQPAITRDVDTGLLPRLAHRRDGEVVIAGLHATTRTRDVAAPRIVRCFGALDHQQLWLTVRARTQREENRRAAHVDPMNGDATRMFGERAKQSNDGGMTLELIELLGGVHPTGATSRSAKNRTVRSVASSSCGDGDVIPCATLNVWVAPAMRRSSALMPAA